MIVRFKFDFACIYCAVIVALCAAMPAFAQEDIAQETAQAETAQDVAPQAAPVQRSVDLNSLSYDARLSDYEYPFDVKYFPIASQGKRLEMAYMYLPGDGTRGTVTLMHGKNFTSAYWEETARFLNSQGYNVLMPDQIGFGKSSKPVDYQYSFAALALHTQTLLNALGIKKSVIVGHSMGGMLATRFALMYPEQTLRLVLVNPIGLENYLHYVEYKDISFFFEREMEQSADRIVFYQKKNYYDNQWSDEYAEIAQPLIGMVQGPDKQQIALVSALTYDMIFTQPVIEEMWKVSVPMSMVLGTRDRTAPGDAWKKEGIRRELGNYDRLGESVQTRQPFLSLYRLEGLGHVPHIENFERFAPVFEEALKILGEPGSHEVFLPPGNKS
jgi:pimeloyl-ACP methyl ester carboxylesterase